MGPGRDEGTAAMRFMMFVMGNSDYEAGQPPSPALMAAIGALARGSNGAPITREALTQPAGFAGVSGIFRLLPNGTNERGLAVAQIRDSQVVVIDPAPRNFAGAGF